MERCLAKLRSEGKIDEPREARARKIYEEIRGSLGDELGAEEIAVKATGDALDRLKRESAESRRQALLQATRQKAILAQMQGYRNARGQADMANGAVAHIDSDEAASFSNVEARRKAILGQAHGQLTDVLSTFRRDMLGRVRQNAKLDNLVRSAFGEAVDDPAARELSKAWLETAEHLRLRFNQAGGHIAKREDWGLPQSHDMLAVRKAGFDEWRAFTMPRLDPARMFNELTGQPMTVAQVEQSLRGVFDTISTDGWASRKASGVGSGGKLANSRSEARFLAFRDADAWLEYQGRFSSGSPFDVMLAHVDNMSREIAAMEILGPNPSATLRWIEQTLLKSGAEADAVAQSGKRSGATNEARKAAKKMRDMWAQYSGASTAPIDETLGRTMAGVRSVLVSAQLGSTTLSALTDLGFQRTARHHAGLPSTSIISGYLKLMSPTAKADQKLAVRLGLIAENWSTIALGQQRYADEVAGPEVATRIADFVMRASLLSPWTQAGRWAFGMEFMGTLADYRGRGFDKLPEPLSNTLKRYGIEAGDWDSIRKTPVYTERGSSFLRPDDVDDDDLATRLLEAIQTETEFAVPTGSLRSKVILTSDIPPGTLIGEVVRSVAMYKNFGVTLVNTHLRRTAMQKGAMGKAAYAANLLIATTAMGALSMQLKSVAKGKEPAPMTGDKAAEFWGAAMLQGGGLGIYGDFLFSDVNRAGSGLGETVAGPVVSALNDVRKVTLGNVTQLPGDKPTNAGREAINFAGRYTPMASLWYLRLGSQRLFLDQLQKEVDPDYQDSFHAMEQRARKDMGQEFWWRPGETMPETME